MSADTESKNKDDSRGVLYVVATPIGHMRDITIRALDVLKTVDLVAAEDTRKTGRLLARYEIQSCLLSYHEHNEASRSGDLVKRLIDGKTIALVSNAGTPTLSDPGYRLVRRAAEAGIRIVPVPGVSAAVAALSVSGLPTDAFVFFGFMSRKKNKRLHQLKRLVHEEKTIVVYESPNRLLDLLADMRQTLGNRYVVLSREMTKQHEEFLRGHIADIMVLLGARSRIKGECTLLISGRRATSTASTAAIRQWIGAALEGDGPRASDLAKQVAARFGCSRQTAYDEILAVQRDRKQFKG